LDGFAAELSHEIRNPLTSIKINLRASSATRATDGFPRKATTRFAWRSGKFGDSMTRCARRCVPAAPRATAIVRRGRDPEGSDRTASAPGGIAGCHHRGRFRRAPQREYRDAEAVRGAFVNIVLNAIEAMPSGGTVRVTALNGSGDAYRDPHR
jgi:signal transduction histidine kinase